MFFGSGKRPHVHFERNSEHGSLTPCNRLRLLSFNIQAGMTVQNYRHYVTRGWQHLLPARQKYQNLNRISDLLHHCDVVALQEIDGGSLRSGFVNQVEYLARLGNFPYWYQQCTRDFGQFGRYGNGLLSRVHPSSVEDHRLPGLLPGRGAIFLRFGDERCELIVINLHLALGRRSRVRQLAYIRELIEGYRHVVIMGDMNTHADQLLEAASPLAGSGLRSAMGGHFTFPSWRPRRGLDHILVSESLEVGDVVVPAVTISDHLPVGLEIRLPEGFSLSRDAA